MHRLILAAFLTLACIPWARAEGRSPTDGQVAVYRGSAIAPARPRAEPRPVAAEFVGGKRLWLVDRERDRLVACRLVRTATVGRSRIRCTGSHLDLEPPPPS